MANTSRPAVTYSRQELYDRVWSVSVVKLAEEIGVSDVAIAKACKKHQIPKPPLGYWAKLAAQKAPARPPLPVVVDPKLQTVTFTPVPRRSRRPNPPPESGDVESARIAEPSFRSQQVADLYARLLDAPPSWTVPASLRSPHTAVANTLAGLHRSVKEHRHTHRDDAGLVVPSSEHDRQTFIEIRVSREQFERAARIAQAILTASLEIGFVLREHGEYYRKGYHLELFGAQVKFGIRKLTRREPHTPTAKEMADQSRYSFRKPPKWDHFPSGILRVSVFPVGSQNELGGWQDGKLRTVESMIREIVLGMLTQVDRHVVRWREERERQQRAFEEAKERQREEERRRQDQRELDELTDQVERWEMARRMRRFLRAAQRTRMDLGLPTPPGSTADTWFRWVSDTADRIDPLSVPNQQKSERGSSERVPD